MFVPLFYRSTHVLSYNICWHCVIFDLSEFVPNFCTVEYDGSCYQLVQQTLGWFSAREHCHNEGGYLADAYTADENNVIRQIVIDYRATGACDIVCQQHEFSLRVQCIDYVLQRNIN